MAANKACFTTNTTHGQPYSGSVTLFFAMRLCMKYLHRTPTIEDLRRDFDMSRATAYRYRAAILAARGEAA